MHSSWFHTKAASLGPLKHCHPPPLPPIIITEYLQCHGIVKLFLFELISKTHLRTKGDNIYSCHSYLFRAPFFLHIIILPFPTHSFHLNIVNHDLDFFQLFAKAFMPTATVSYLTVCWSMFAVTTLWYLNAFIVTTWEKWILKVLLCHDGVGTIATV